MSAQVDQPDPLCAQAYSYRSFLQINLIQYMQIILAICSIFLVCYLTRTDEFRRLSAIIRPSLKVDFGVNLLYTKFLDCCFTWDSDLYSRFHFFFYLLCLYYSKLFLCRFKKFYQTGLIVRNSF
jgi:hypothetical protein